MKDSILRRFVKEEEENNTASQKEVTENGDQRVKVETKAKAKKIYTQQPPTQTRLWY